MIDQSTEKIFLHYINKNPSLFEIIDDEYFTNKELKILYTINKKFYSKYHKIPSKEQLKQIIEEKKITTFFTQNEFNSDLFNLINSVNLLEYDENWVDENFEAWLKYKALDSSVFDLVNYLKTTKITPENISNVVNTSLEIIQKRNNIELNMDEGSDFFDPNKHIPFKSNCLTTGYRWFDKCLGGGYNTGQLIICAGAAKAGKCVDFDTYINIRNKKTGEVKKIKIGEFYNLVKNQNKANEKTNAQ